LPEIKDIQKYVEKVGIDNLIIAGNQGGIIIIENIE